MVSCPSDEALNQFLVDADDGKRDQEIADHIEQCESCQEQLRERTDWGPLSRFRKYIRTGDAVGFSDNGGDTSVRERLRIIPYVHNHRSRRKEHEEELPGAIDKYEVVAVLGQGRTGVVYLVYDAVLERAFAVKVIAIEGPQQPEAIKCMRDEVKAVEQLDHPNVVHVTNAGELDDGRPFLVMDFVDGRNLDELVDSDGPMDPGLACRAIVDAARGLQHAHQRNIIHGGVKPSNLIQEPGGAVRIADFGLAALNPARGSQPDEQAETEADTGTSGFIAPEQLLDMNSVDERSDIYSLGCTLGYLLTGKRPFEGETALKILRVHPDQTRSDPEEALPDLPAGLINAFQKMVHPDPDKRFQSMADVIEAVEPFSVEDAADAGAAFRFLFSWKVWIVVAALLLAAVYLTIRSFE